MKKEKLTIIAVIVLVLVIVVVAICVSNDRTHKGTSEGQSVS